MSTSIQFLGGALSLHQPEHGFKSGMDAVFLAAACPAKAGQSVLDMGCGVGTAGLCLLQRVNGVNLTGVDIQADHVALARTNAAENGFDATFAVADIYDYEAPPYDHVICNPPYMEEGQSTQSPETAVALAKSEARLQDWVNAALRTLKGRGVFTMVHRADHLDHILNAFDGRFGGVEIFPLWPKRGTPAKRVIIRAIRDSRSPTIIHPGLVLHENNGDYTDVAEGILRQCGSLL